MPHDPALREGRLGFDARFSRSCVNFFEALFVEKVLACKRRYWIVLNGGNFGTHRPAAPTSHTPGPCGTLTERGGLAVTGGTGSGSALRSKPKSYYH